MPNTNNTMSIPEFKKYLEEKKKREERKRNVAGLGAITSGLGTFAGISNSMLPLLGVDINPEATAALTLGSLLGLAISIYHLTNASDKLRATRQMLIALDKDELPANINDLASLDNHVDEVSSEIRSERSERLMLTNNYINPYSYPSYSRKSA